MERHLFTVPAYFGRLDIARYLLTAHAANLEATDSLGRTPLHWACNNGELDIARYLLTAHAANLEATDNDGRTPLQVACNGGRLDVVRYLLTSHGANLEATDSLGWTALQRACNQRNLAVVQELAARGANLEATDDRWKDASSNGLHPEDILLWFKNWLPVVQISRPRTDVLADGLVVSGIEKRWKDTSSPAAQWSP